MPLPAPVIKIVLFVSFIVKCPALIKHTRLPNTSDTIVLHGADPPCATPCTVRQERILRAQVAPGSLGRYPRKLTAAPSENSSGPTPPGLRETRRGAAPPRLWQVLPWF